MDEIGDKTATIKLDNLLDKVNIISSHSDSLFEEYKNKLNNKKEMISINGIDLFEKGKVTYNFKITKVFDKRVANVIDTVRNNEFIDKEWLSLMDFSVQYGIRAGSRAIGRVWYSNNHIELQKSYFKNTADGYSIKETVLHEIGHIWWINIFYKFKLNLDYTKFEKLAVGLYLEKIGVDINPKHWSFKKWKSKIALYITGYGRKNIHEAFSELFSIAHIYGIYSWSSEARVKENELALEAIREVTKIAWVELWNSFN